MSRKRNNQQVDDEFEQLTPEEHILRRKNMYMGNCECCEKSLFTITTENNEQIYKKEKLQYCPGLLKLIDEPIMNAIDQIKKGHTRNINIEIGKYNDKNKTVMIKIENDGDSINIGNWKGTNTPIPQKLFSEALTGSNFKETTDTSGQNGVGVKLVSLFSLKFILVIIKNKKRYEQHFTKNNTNKTIPSITNTNEKNIVSITFYPELSRLDDSINDWNDIIENTKKIIAYKVHTLKALSRTTNITYNNEQISDISFETLSFNTWKAIQTKTRKNNNIFTEDKFHYIQKSNYSLFIALSTVSDQISFVNKIMTTDGGTHISYIVRQIASEINGLTTTNLKSKLFIGITIDISSPKFESQAKTKLATGNDLKFLTLSASDRNAICTKLNLKQLLDTKTKERINNEYKSLKDCTKLIDAEKAGKPGEFNTLFICEGDSASSLAKTGMTCKNIGHKNYGCLPLMGKISNVRNTNCKYVKALKSIGSNDEKEKKESEKQIAKNVITQIFRALGMQLGKTITDINQLRYQRIIMLKDADSDGANILVLVYSLFETYLTELLKIKGFFCEFITPMIKVVVSKSFFDKYRPKIIGTIVSKENDIILPFYNKTDYNEFMNEYKTFLPKNVHVEFVKGLAGHQSFEIKEYFRHFEDNVIPIIYDNETHEQLNRALNRKKDSAASRREWIAEFDNTKTLSRKSGVPINMSEFLNNDNLEYMLDSCIRAIPSNIDGLKPVHRKILFGLRKQANPYKFMKVFQVAGLIANVANYHHGDSSLNEAIIKMTQTFPGSNNIALLTGKGFFGSRYLNGDDAGKPRYIDVCLSKITDIIYPSIDDDLLEYKEEDNQIVEPKYYIPIIPVILLNGSTGVASGWMTEIPMHSIESLITSIRNKLSNKKIDLKIHINDWKGTISINDTINNKFKKSISYRGVVKKLSSRKFQVIDIPTDITLTKFDEMLKSSEIVESIRNHNEKELDNIDIEVILSEEFINNLGKEFTEEMFISKFKLVKTLPYDNGRNAFDRNETLKQYISEEEMFDEWYELRCKLYEKRLVKLITIYEIKLKKLCNIIKFINEVVITKKLKISKMKIDEINEYLTKKEYDKIDDSYSYLLQTSFLKCTKENIKKLENEQQETKKELERLKTLTVKDIWQEDLIKLENELIN